MKQTCATFSLLRNALACHQDWQEARRSLDPKPGRDVVIIGGGGKTPAGNLFLNCGWGTGGFKATPGSGFVYARTIAAGEPHSFAAPVSLERFHSGRLIDEHRASGVEH
jgi:hypothetical protein